MKIVIVQGHPDPAEARFGRALGEAYAAGALAAGHQVRRIDVARLEFSLLRTKDEFEHAPVPPALAEPQASVAWADHLVLVYPLWLGEMPALLKGFFEQVLRPGFAFPAARGAPSLRGKSARVIVTMGMPAAIYRWYYRAHGLKTLTRNVLNFVGIAPVRSTLIGRVESLSDRSRAAWLAHANRLGRRAR